MNTLFNILLAGQILICAAMAGLILIQRSEGGALGTGGGPSGFMSARGAGNLLTRITGILAVLFFANSIGMTIVGNRLNRVTSAVDSVDTSKLTLPAPSSAPPAATAQQPAASSNAAPSLNDLPLANAPTVAPVQAQPAKPTSGASRSASLPAALPANSGVSSVSAKDVSKAKSSIWESSSAAPAASKAASSTPQ